MILIYCLQNDHGICVVHVLHKIIEKTIVKLTTLTTSNADVTNLCECVCES